MKRRYHAMRLTKFKKTVFSVGLGVSLVSGAMVALAETPQVITRVSADAQHSQVIEDGNTTYIIQAPGQRAPSPIVTPGVTTNIIRSTASNATSSNATSSNASRSRSSSGGSGSVISVLLMKELMAENRNVMSIVVGDATTRNYAYNTQATLRSYESIARQSKKPAVVKYFQNYASSAVSPKLSPQEVNKKISQAVLDLRILTSGNVHGVDSADITNFLDYTKVSSVPASLSLLANVVTPVDSDERELERVLKTDLDDTQPISVITINTTEDTEHQEIKCTYRVEGKFEYVSKEKPLYNVHFTIHDSDLMARVINELTKSIEEFDKKENVRVRSSINVADSDNESGLVF